MEVVNLVQEKLVGDIPFGKKVGKDGKARPLKYKKSEKPNEFEEFVKHVRGVALDSDAPAAVMGIYKELLKYKEQLGKEKVISGDELARQNIEAERQLREGGYIQ